MQLVCVMVLVCVSVEEGAARAALPIAGSCQAWPAGESKSNKG